MYRLIKNEFLKEIKKRKTIVMLFILILVILFSNVYALSNRKNSTPENRIKQNQSYINDFKVKLQNSSNEGDKSKISNKINELESFNKELQFDIDNRNAGWKVLAQKKVTDYGNEIGQLSNDSNNQKQSLEINKEMYQYCIDKNIEPTFSESNSKAFGLISDISRLVSVFFIPILVVVLISDSVSGEFNPMTIRMLLVRPVSKSKIYLSKFIASNIIIVGSIILLELINFLILGCFFGFESPLLPNIVGAKYSNDLLNGVALVPKSVYLIPMWQLIFEGVALQILYIMCACAFIMMISTFTKNSVLSIAFSSVACTIEAFFINVASRSDIKIIKMLYTYFFASYFDGMGLLIGDLSKALKNPQISVSNGILLMVSQLIIFYCAGLLFFNRKNLHV